MSSTIKKLFLISRPISWLNTAYPFAAAYLVTGGVIDLTFLVATLYFLIPYNLLMYGVNDVYDYDSDIRNPRKGGIEGAIEHKSFHPIILRSALLLNIPPVLYLLLVGSVVSNILLIAVLFFVVAYSLVGLRFKEIPVLDSITSAVHFVGPMVIGLAMTGFEPHYVPYVAAFMLWGIASHAFGAVQDIIPDRDAGIASIATVFGANVTIKLVILLYSAASIILASLGWPEVVVAIVGLSYVVNALLYIGVKDDNSDSTNRGWKRFIWLNMVTGFVITNVLILANINL